MAPSERNALLFFAAIALMGAGVRAVRAISTEDTPDVRAAEALETHVRAVDSARRSRGSRGSRGSKRGPASIPSIPSTSLDLDTAPAESLVRLPRIGPALARRIVADRDSLGPFGSMQEFQRVRGVGPAMANALAPYVTFSGTPRPSRVGARLSTPRRTPKGTARQPRISP
jgi:competence protein ComEA